MTEIENLIKAILKTPCIVSQQYNKVINYLQNNEFNKFTFSKIEDDIRIFCIGTHSEFDFLTENELKTKQEHFFNLVNSITNFKFIDDCLHGFLYLEAIDENSIGKFLGTIKAFIEIEKGLRTDSEKNNKIILDFLTTKDIEKQNIDHCRTLKPLSNIEIDELFMLFRKHKFFQKFYKNAKEYEKTTTQYFIENGVNDGNVSARHFFVFYCLYLLQQAKEFIDNYKDNDIVYERLESISRDFFETTIITEKYDKETIYLDEYNFFCDVIDLINEMITNYSEWFLPKPNDNFLILINDRIVEIKDCNKEYFYSERDNLSTQLEQANNEIENLRKQLQNNLNNITNEIIMGNKIQIRDIRGNNGQIAIGKKNKNATDSNDETAKKSFILQKWELIVAIIAIIVGAILTIIFSY
jgi:hypothetical protein